MQSNTLPPRHGRTDSSPPQAESQTTAMQEGVADASHAHRHCRRWTGRTCCRLYTCSRAMWGVGRVHNHNHNHNRDAGGLFVGGRHLFCCKKNTDQFTVPPHQHSAYFFMLSSSLRPLRRRLPVAACATRAATRRWVGETSSAAHPPERAARERAYSIRSRKVRKCDVGKLM